MLRSRRCSDKKQRNYFREHFIIMYNPFLMGIPFLVRKLKIMIKHHGGGTRFGIAALVTLTARDQRFVIAPPFRYFVS